MTPREKILRDALDKIEKREWQETEVGPPFEGKVRTERTLSGENAQQALAEADAVKGGPSEEDRKRLKEILGQYRAVNKYTDTENLRGVAYELINDLNWVGGQLKKYMRIE